MGSSTEGLGAEAPLRCSDSFQGGVVLSLSADCTAIKEALTCCLKLSLPQVAMASTVQYPFPVSYMPV